MVIPSTSSIVLVRFPFSDLTQSKLRPAVVLADAGRGDWILCQVTSNPYGDTQAITLDAASFATGSLRVTSCPPRQTIHGQPQFDGIADWNPKACAFRTGHWNHCKNPSSQPLDFGAVL